MKTLASVLWVIFSIVLIASALIGLFTPLEVFASFIFFLPFILIVGGVSNLAYYLSYRDFEGSSLLLMDGILNFIFAFVFIASGVEFTSLATIYFFAFMTAFKGILGISYALELKKGGFSGWGLSLVWAILTLVVAAIFIAVPTIGGITLGVMISLLVLFFGLVSLFAFFGIKRVLS